MNETSTYKKLKNSFHDNHPRMIIVHHSGGTDRDPMADTSGHTAQSMEAYHLSKGWEGLAYQYVIHSNGDIWLGRPEFYHGAHTTNYNFESIGICLSGNFDFSLPTKEQEISLVKLIKDILARYPNIGEIYPHRKFADKSCYGKRLSDVWARDLIYKVNSSEKKSDLIKKIDELISQLQEIRSTLL